MGSDINRIEPSFPYEKYQIQNINTRHQIEEILKSYLILKSPSSSQEKKEMVKVTKNMSLLIFILKEEILPVKEMDKLSYEIKDLYDHFQSDTLLNNSDLLIQNLKNSDSKTNTKIQILQAMIDIENAVCIENKALSSDELNKKFSEILNLLKTSDSFHLIKLERNMEDIKEKILSFPDDRNYILQLLDSIPR